MDLRRLLFLLPAFIFVGVGIGLAVGLTRDPSTLPSALIDKPVPTFELPPLAGRDGPSFSSADLGGRVSLVNVFASWCVPCRVEHPLLMALADDGVPIYGINYKDPADKANEWLAGLGDPTGRSAPTRRDASPSTGGVRRARDLRGRYRGADPASPRRAAAAARRRGDDQAAARGACRMRRWLAVLLLALSCFAALPGHAATNPDEILQDPALEQRARGLSKQLRCLVCQNQSIDDPTPISPATCGGSCASSWSPAKATARSSLRDRALRRLRAARPPVEPATWGLWFGPALVLVIAAAGLVVYVRARAGRPDHRPPDLDPEERRRLDALLREDSATSGS